MRIPKDFQPFVEIAERAYPGFQHQDRKGRPISVGMATYLKYAHPTYDRVGDTYLGPDFPQVRVSTVWLGEPQLGQWRRPQFETMVFTTDDFDCLDELTVRYWTLRQAEIGHRRMVRVVKALVRSPRLRVKPKRRRHWR